MKRTILFLLALSLASFVAGAAGQAKAQTLPTMPPEFSADVHMLMDGKPMMSGKFHMGKNAVRMDMTQVGQSVSAIHRMDKGVMWVLMGPMKTYIEQPMDFNPLIKADIPGFTQTCTSGETIDNHPTDRCVLTGSVGGKQTTTTIWKAKDLNGAVIRNTGEQGAGMELKNIVLGAQPPSLFELPQGYQKMTTGALPLPSQNK